MSRSILAKVHQAEPTSTPAPIATPVVEAVAYEPGAIIRSGNMNALAESFDPDAALEQIEILSGPPFNGRRAGSTGGLAAGDYLAEQFAALGLQPAGDNGTFFQSFPISYTNLSAVPNLTLTLPDSTIDDSYRLHQDYAPVVQDYVGEGRGSGDLVWMNQCSHEDFGLLNVEDKIVLCQPEPDRSSYLQANRDAVEHGAGGLLYVTDPEQRPPDMGNRFTLPWIPDPIPALRVYPRLVDDLFQGSGTTITDTLLLDEPMPLAVKVDIEIETLGHHACPAATDIGGCTGRNVLAVLPGRDLDYAHEVVIIGAHYDHLGDAPAEGNERTTWPGANDDASGTAVLLEIARNWQEQGYVPRRTVMFAAWDAEELGLLGSIHYVENPSYPPEDVVAMLQMDMVGSGGDVLFVDGPDELAARVAGAADGIEYPLQQIQMGRSDHVPFLNAGIPAALLIWLDENGQTPSHYHRPADTPDVIDLDKLETVGELAALTTLNLAENEPAILALLEERAAALTAADRSGFLATSTAAQQTVDGHWFDDLSAHNPITVTINTNDLQLQGSLATANTTIQATYPAGEGLQTVNGSLEAQFERTSGGWRWAGPHLEQVSDAGVTVSYPGGIEDDLGNLPAAIRGQYDPIAKALGLQSGAPISLQLFPDAPSLRSGTALFWPEEQPKLGRSRVGSNCLYERH